MKFIFATFVLFALSVCAFAQAVPAGFDLSNYGVKIEPDKRVIVVLATLEAARTENEKGEPVPVLNTKLSEPGKQFRELLKSDLAGIRPDLRQRISQFVIAHKRRYPNLNDEQLVAPFVSMAYSLTQVPDLADPVVTSDLPGSLLDVLDFAPLVRDLYRTTNIGANLNEYVKAYQAESDKSIRPSARSMISQLLGYLHTKPQLTVVERVRTETTKTNQKKSSIGITKDRIRERHFVIVPEMLAPVGYVNFVNVKDDYHAVVPADSDLTLSEVRRAYLQFVVDPLILSVGKDLETVRLEYKKALDERRRIDPSVSPDVFLSASRSLVAAIDARELEQFKNRVASERARARLTAIGGTDPTKKIAEELDKVKKENAEETLLRMSEDYEKGAVFVFYFADQMAALEVSGTDIAGSIREIVLSFDAAKEVGRYESYADVRKRALAVREERKNQTAAVVDNPVLRGLLEIQNTIKTKNYKQAEAELKQLLEKYPDDPRIYFNIGRVAAISAEMIDGDVEAQGQRAKYLEAKVAFENVLRISNARDLEVKKTGDTSRRVDPALISVTYVSLARIFEYYDRKTDAIAIYDAAIKLGDVAGGAYNEALTSKQRLLKNQ